MKNNVLKNFFYQSIFQVTKIILPFITIPIVSKALGPSGVGIFNYTNSVVQYFVLLTSLGIATYSNREIAMAIGKKKDISVLFWEIFLLKIVIGFSVLLIYVFIIQFLSYNHLYLYQTLFILGAIFDISWLFMGVEDFKKTSLVNLFVQILSFLGIVFFVKDATDLNKYVLIQSLGTFSSQIIIWLFLKQYVKFTTIKIKRIIFHIKGSIDFFILQITIMLYTNLNKTIIGFMYAPIFVGYYTNGIQLATMIVTIITTFDMVLLPHMSNLFAQNSVKKIISIMEKTIHLQLFVSIPMMFGILVIYDKFIPWFFGDKFLYLKNIMPYFSILIVIIPLGTAIARQYLTPLGEIKKFNKSVIIGAIINITCIIMLTPFLGFIGVVFAIIIAEFFVTFTRVYSFVKETKFKFNYKKISIFLFSGIVMLYFSRLFTHNMVASIWTTLIQVIIGSVIYMFLTFLFKVNEFYNIYLERK